MSFQENFEEFLSLEQGFAVVAQIIPAAGKAYKVKGIFSNEYLNIDLGMAGFSSSNPIFEGPFSKIKGVEYGDFLQVNEENYRIVGIRPDGTGWVKLELERQD